MVAHTLRFNRVCSCAYNAVAAVDAGSESADTRASVVATCSLVEREVVVSSRQV